MHSSGNRTSTHYNLQLGGETALMTKEHFIERYGVPLYTVGVGGSGGAIQQYVYGAEPPGPDRRGASRSTSYPDMVTQTIHVGDCELLEHYMDVTDAGQPEVAELGQPRRGWIGLNAQRRRAQPVHAARSPAATSASTGWRGLTPLALNPLFGYGRRRHRAYGPGR